MMQSTYDRELVLEVLTQIFEANGLRIIEISLQQAAGKELAVYAGFTWHNLTFVLSY